MTEDERPTGFQRWVARYGALFIPLFFSLAVGEWMGFLRANESNSLPGYWFWLAMFIFNIGFCTWWMFVVRAAKETMETNTRIDRP